MSYGDAPNRAPDVVVLPLELKTGNTVTAVAHRAQVAYYGMLMSDRYGEV